MSVELTSTIVKQLAYQLGFQFCGMSEAVFLETEAPRLENWLNLQRHGLMAYMERYFDLRLDPRLLVEDAKSVITVLLNYYPSQIAQSEVNIAKYAWGEDYHFVVKDKLFQLLTQLKTYVPDLNGRAFVDSAPVMDKAWAQKSGLGWIGKHSNLIVPKAGSFYFIGELIIDYPLTYDAPIKDFCGTCTRCIEACPTEAIVEPYQVDANKCIAYLTIELREAIPQEFHQSLGNWAFGCDICQDVCPWNQQFATPHTEPRFNPLPQISDFTLQDWLAVEESAFKKIFKQSPLQRSNYQGLQRNLKLIEQQPKK